MKTKKAAKQPSLAVGIRRILKLADFVETKPRHRFDFSVIVGSDWEGNPNLSCGTTACGLGWATAMPLFQKLGLYLDKYDRQVRLMSSSEYETWGNIGKQIFGGISLAVMYSLFQPKTYAMKDNEFYDYDSDTQFPYLTEDATPKQWARHARKVAAMLKKQI